MDADRESGDVVSPIPAISGNQTGSDDESSKSFIPDVIAKSGINHAVCFLFPHIQPSQHPANITHFVDRNGSRGTPFFPLLRKQTNNHPPLPNPSKRTVAAECNLVMQLAGRSFDPRFLPQRHVEDMMHGNNRTWSFVVCITTYSDSAPRCLRFPSRWFSVMYFKPVVSWHGRRRTRGEGRSGFSPGLVIHLCPGDSKALNVVLIREGDNHGLD